MKNVAVIVAGGCGSRFAASINNINDIKLRENLDIIDATNKHQIIKQNIILPQFGVTSLEKCIIQFEKSRYIDIIIAVCSENTQINFAKKHAQKPLFFVKSGKERFNSVANALNFLHTNFYDAINLALIHDAARPFVDTLTIDNVVKALADGNFVGAIPVISMTDTIKQIHNGKIQTLDRSNIFRAQTPQGFKFNILLDCYQNLGLLENTTNHESKNITDDCSVVEKFFADKIKFVNGSEQNGKITTVSDYRKNINPI